MRCGPLEDDASAWQQGAEAFSIGTEELSRSCVIRGVQLKSHVLSYDRELPNNYWVQ